MNDNTADEIVKDCTIAEQHPCTHGHFPGRPIVPGGFLLARIEALLAEDEPARRFTGIRKAKFLRPLTPGEQAFLHYRLGSGGGVRFSVRTAAGAVLEGSGTLTVTVGR